MNTVALILVIIGALNWGLVAIDPNANLLNLIFGSPYGVGPGIVYVIIALAGLWCITFFFRKSPILRDRRDKR